MYTQLESKTNPSEIEQIMNMLLTLPLEKVAEVRDYVEFLQSRYSSDSHIDINDAWSDDDLTDFATASMMYLSNSIAVSEDSDV